MQRLFFTSAVLAEILGIAVACIACYYVYSYFTDTKNELRNELLVGSTLGFMYGSILFAYATVAVTVSRNHIPRLPFNLIAWPSIAIGLTSLVLYIYLS